MRDSDDNESTTKRRKIEDENTAQVADAMLVNQRATSSTDAGGAVVNEGANDIESRRTSEKERDGKEDRSNVSSDEEDAVAQQVKAALQASDSDSDSSSEDSQVAKPADASQEKAHLPNAIEANGEVAAEQAQGLVVQPAAKDAESSASDSDSSSDSSSSSSSSSASSSDDEAEGDDIENALEVADVTKLDGPKKLHILQRAQLRRDDIVKVLLNLPDDEAHDVLKKAFVRLVVRTQSSAQDACVLAQIADVLPCAPYSVPVAGDRGIDPRVIAVQLKCQRGSSLRTVKISTVSNQDATEQEFEQWQRLTKRTQGLEVSFHLEQMQQKARDIESSRKLSFDELRVARVLAKKPQIEFNAQKQSRMQFLVQCALSQMDFSGIRDNEADELEAKYQEALRGLHEAERASTETQEEWFKKRPNLFSIKMINEKNLERQVRDDRHALEYALETEKSLSSEKNPFQRRPCRPECAWDTQLTGDVAGSKGDSKPASDKPVADAAAPGQQPSKVTGTDAQPHPVMLDSATRIDRVMQAHRKANLLSKLSPLIAQVAS